MDQTAGNERATLAVPIVDPEIVKHLRALRALGWGTKRFARELGIAQNSVRRYLREGEAASVTIRVYVPREQSRPSTKRIDGHVSAR